MMISQVAWFLSMHYHTTFKRILKISKGKLYPQMLNSGLLDSQYLHVDVLYAFNSYCE